MSKSNSIALRPVSSGHDRRGCDVGVTIGTSGVGVALTVVGCSAAGAEAHADNVITSAVSRCHVVSRISPSLPQMGRKPIGLINSQRPFLGITSRLGIHPPEDRFGEILAVTSDIV